MRYCFTLLLLFSFCKISSQELKDPVFHHLEPEKLGVKSSGVPCWDKTGRLWSVYEDGILCYNGYSSRKFPADGKNILSRSVVTLYIDKKDFLWIAYSDSTSITRFNTSDASVRHYPRRSDNPAHAPPGTITAFREDSKNNFWILTWGGGIGKINTETGVCKTYLPYPSPETKSSEYANRIKDFIEMPDGRFFVSCFSNEHSPYLPQYFDPATGTFTPFPVKEYLANSEKELQEKIEMSIKITHFTYGDNNGNFWLGTYSGLLFIDNKNKKIERITPLKDLTKGNLDNTRAYAVSGDKLWVGTPNAGIMLVDMQSRKSKYIKHDTKISSSLSDNRTRSIKADPQGNIWIGTGLGGYSIYNPLVQQFNLVEWKDLDLEFTNRSQQTIPVNQMLVHPSGKIYISSENGIYIYDTDSGRIIRKIDPAATLNKNIQDKGIRSRVQDMSFISGNKMLVISPNQPAILDLTSGKFTRLDVPGPRGKRASYFVLFRHLRGQKPAVVFTQGWWGDFFAVDTGTYKVDSLFSFSFDRSEFSTNYSYILKDGRWLLSRGEKEFVLFDPSNKTYKRAGARRDIDFPDSSIKIAYLREDGNILFGTSRGLYSFDPQSGHHEYMNDKLGLGNSPVNAVIKDKDGVWWMSLDKYLFKYDEKSGRGFRIGGDLGLHAGSFLGAIAQSDNKGRIYIASLNGALIFDPARVKTPERKPLLYIGTMSVKEDTMDMKRTREFAEGKCMFRWNENFLSLELGTGEVYTPMPHHFYYRVIGMDSNWQNNGNSNRIRLTNLSHGSYTIEARVINGYGIGSDVLAIPFAVKAPFWFTWWFYLLAGLAAISGVYAFIRYREKAFIKQQMILEEKIRERTAEVMAKADEIRRQKDIILEKNKELTDSMHYAKRIQNSLLPSAKYIQRILEQLKGKGEAESS